MVEGVQSCSAMAQGGREGNTFEINVFFPISFFLALSSFCPSFFFLGARKEVRQEMRMVCKDIGVNKGVHQLQTLRHRWSSGWALSDAVWGLVN
jgi:hypothetical protein